MRAKWAFWRRPSFLAFFLVCRFEVLQESGSYMVELAALPFFFEMIFLLVREEGRKRQARREAVAELEGAELGIGAVLHEIG